MFGLLCCAVMCTYPVRMLPLKSIRSWLSCPMPLPLACRRARCVRQTGDAVMPDSMAAAAADQQQDPRPSEEAASLEQLSISGDEEGAAAAFGSPVDVDASPLLAGVSVSGG